MKLNMYHMLLHEQLHSLPKSILQNGREMGYIDLDKGCHGI